MMSVLPATLAMSMTPALLNPTTTVANVVFPGSTSMFDVPGLLVPSGQSVRYVVAVAPTTVRLSTIAEAPAGMLFAPVTCQVSTSCVGDRCIAWFGAYRLSIARTGVMGVNALCTGGVACAIHDWDTANV